MKNTTLELHNLSKQFHGTYVLRNINLTLREGDILGLLGVNGSGKSTLLNIISGSPVIARTGSYEGEIRIGGLPVTLSSVIDSQRHGIAMVHQEFNLMEDLTVWENIALARQAIRTPGDLGRSLRPVDATRGRTEAKMVLSRLGVHLDPDTRVSDLPVNEKQFVEIARCISAENARILMLDEPTATLNAKDAALLLQYLRNLADTGMTILFISHRIEEVMGLASRIMVLRDGQTVYTNDDPGSFRAEVLSAQMIGTQYSFDQQMRRSHTGSRDVILHYENFSVHRPMEPIRSLDLDIYQGEIIGLTGLSGHGQNALAFGTMHIDPTDGILQYAPDGVERTVSSPAEAIALGMTFVTEERRKNGLLMGFPVAHNINFLRQCFTRELDLLHLGRAVRFRDPKRCRASAGGAIDGCGIVCRSPEQPVQELSGGNQQKVALARAMLLHPKVLFLNEPTRGIDIKSKDTVLSMLEQLNEQQHTTIILASSDPDELRRICDRICIFYEGRLEKIHSCSSTALCDTGKGVG